MCTEAKQASYRVLAGNMNNKLLPAVRTVYTRQYYNMFSWYYKNIFPGNLRILIMRYYFVQFSSRKFCEVTSFQASGALICYSTAG